jgi:hypothetical protein
MIPKETRKIIIYDPKAEYLSSSAWILAGLRIIYFMFFLLGKQTPF